MSTSAGLEATFVLTPDAHPYNVAGCRHAPGLFKLVQSLGCCQNGYDAT